MTSGPVYYHGGIPGLRIGQHILPPDVTGAFSVADTSSATAEQQAVIERVYRCDRVYLTTERGVAELWACLAPEGTPARGGDVYRVQPEGDIEPDPDWNGEPGVSVCVPRALIVGIAGTGIRRALAGRLIAEHG